MALNCVTSDTNKQTNKHDNCKKAPSIIWSFIKTPPNRYVINLSNEVLNLDFGQGTAKISEVKIGVLKKYLPTRPTLGAPTLTSDIFAAL